MFVIRRTGLMPVWWLVLLTCGMPVMVPGMASGQDTPVFLEPDRDGVQRATIILDSYAFTPNRLSIQSGAPVALRLENRSLLTPHNFIIDSSVPDIQHNVNVSAGTSVLLRFLPATPGEYVFYCDKQLLFFPSHREEGMEGYLDVR